LAPVTALRRLKKPAAAKDTNPDCHTEWGRHGGKRPVMAAPALTPVPADGMRKCS